MLRLVLSDNPKLPDNAVIIRRRKSETPERSVVPEFPESIVSKNIRSDRQSSPKLENAISEISTVNIGRPRLPEPEPELVIETKIERKKSNVSKADDDRPRKTEEVSKKIELKRTPKLLNPINPANPLLQVSML